MKTVAVVFGGKSLEHDISILTGLQVLSNLNQDYKVVPIFIDKQGIWWTGEKLKEFNTFLNFNEKGLKQCFLIAGHKKLFLKGKLKTKSQNIDVFILALHGQNGEDGAIQGLFEMCEIPYSSCGVMSSAITMDKAFCKMVLKQNQISTPDFLSFCECEWKTNTQKLLDEIKNKFDFQVVVKPATAGSSIGISRCFCENDLKKAVDISFCFAEKVIVEQAISNFKEINLACVGDKQSVTLSVFEEVVSNKQFLDFDEKYVNSAKVKRIVDAKLSSKVSNQIQSMAKKAFLVCDCFGVVRMDFLVTENQVFLNEINSIPGSMANYLFKKVSFAKLCEKLVDLAIIRAKNKEKLLKTYNSQALQAFSLVSNQKLFK